jgi:hypothetical protein
MHTSSNKKLKGTRIINSLILDRLRNQYGENWVVGNDTTLNKDTAN